MKTIISLILFFFPSFIQVPLRRLMGQKIGKGSKIKFGTFFSSSKVDIGEKVNVGPFSFVKSEQITIGDKTNIKALSILSTRVIKLGKYVHVSPLSVISSEFTEQSILEIGDHSRLFPFCWIDTGDGVFIGKNVGIGGHTLIFTHGVWANYLDGGPVTFGPVKIEDNVWLPWRVFILPNVTIGKDTIVGANSLVNKSCGENVLIGGNPAKVIKENIKNSISEDHRKERLDEILSDFSSYIEFKFKIKSILSNNELKFDKFSIFIDDSKLSNKGDLVFFMNQKQSELELKELNLRGVSTIDHESKLAIIIENKNVVFINFVSFMRRYGIRLYIN